jgi:photosystem II stability/assembly factor-like uncharacterized protein
VSNLSLQQMIKITFTTQGAVQWDQLTRQAFHQYLAIDLDGVVLSAPLVEPTQAEFTSFRGMAQIAGDFTKARARYLAAVIGSGPLTSILRPPGTATSPTPTTSVPPASTKFEPDGVAFWDARRGLLISTLPSSSCQAGYEPCPAGVVLRTTDGGRTWQTVENVAGTLSAARVTGTDVAWVSWDTRLLVTTDAGQTWTGTNPDTPVSSVSPVSSSVAWAVGGSQTGAFPMGTSLVMSTDSGRTWRSENDPCTQPSEGDLSTVDFTGPKTGWAMCASQPATDMQAKALYFTDDGAVSWHLQSSCPFGAEVQTVGSLSCMGYLPRMDFLADGHGWMWTDRWGLAATSDGGANWQAIAKAIVFDDANSVLSASLVTDGTGFLLLSSPESQAGCSITGCGPQLLTTTDGGTTWTTLSPGAGLT